MYTISRGKAMEPRALLEKAFFDLDAVDCVGWVFDEAWEKFAQVTVDSNADAVMLAKANVAQVVLTNAVARGTKDAERLKAAVFGWLQMRAFADC
jgi:hypothetical protein